LAEWLIQSGRGGRPWPHANTSRPSSPRPAEPLSDRLAARGRAHAWAGAGDVGRRRHGVPRAPCFGRFSGRLWRRRSPFAVSIPRVSGWSPVARPSGNTCKYR